MMTREFPTPPRHALAVEVLEQRDRELACDAESFLERGDVNPDPGALRSVERRHLLLQSFQRFLVKEERVHFHENLLPLQQREHPARRSPAPRRPLTRPPPDRAASTLRCERRLRSPHAPLPPRAAARRGESTARAGRVRRWFPTSRSSSSARSNTAGWPRAQQALPRLFPRQPFRSGAAAWCAASRSTVALVNRSSTAGRHEHVAHAHGGLALDERIEVRLDRGRLDAGARDEGAQREAGAAGILHHERHGAQPGRARPAASSKSRRRHRSTAASLRMPARGGRGSRISPPAIVTGGE